MQQKLYLLINKLVETTGGHSVACTDLRSFPWCGLNNKRLFIYSSQAWGSVVCFFSVSDCAVFLMSLIILFTTEVVSARQPHASSLEQAFVWLFGAASKHENPQVLGSELSLWFVFIS